MKWQRLVWGFFLLWPLTVFAAFPAELLGLRIQPDSDATRITFILSKKTFGHVTTLSQPDRIMVELAHTTHSLTLNNKQGAKVRGAMITDLKTERTAKGSLYFTFYVNTPVHSTIRFLPDEKDSGVRLQLEIVPVKQSPSQKELMQAFKKDLAALSLEVAHSPRPLVSAKKINTLKPRYFTVVIDAGHGGKDPGARGVQGTEEKMIVLRIAKKLAEAINREANMRAILTRKSDYYIPLRERLALARKNKADIFIAIHADAYFNNQASGASVYALSERAATSEAARWLAKRENYSELGGVELNELKDRSRLLRSVLIDLAQTATNKDSLRLGNQVLDALEGVTSLHYARVEQAPFMVLKSPDIPSILVETGFISNPKEEVRLRDGRYQDKIADALFVGIKRYVRRAT